MKSNIKSIKGFVLGFGCCALLTSGIAYAADAVKLDAYFGVKLMQNGIDKTPQDKKPFIVDGSTYVPLKAVSELLGANISWDGDNSAVILGQKVEGEPLPTPSAMKSDYSFKLLSNQQMTINGKSYGNVGTSFSSGGGYSDNRTSLATYDLNSQFSYLTLSVGMDDKGYSTYSAATRTVSFKNQDGKVIKQVVLGKGSIQEALKLDVKGVLQLNVEITGVEDGTCIIDLINPVLSK